MRFLFLAFVISLVTGCASVKVNYVPETISISEPPLGSVNEKRVGDELLKQGKYREHDALRVLVPVKAHWAYTIHPGYFLKLGEDQENMFFRVGGAGDQSGFIQKAAIADAYQSIMVKKATNTICVVTVFSAAACGSDERTGFEFVKRPLVSEDSVQRTLIYSGRVGNKINIGYREFSGNYARPAFNNSVEYDLAESNKIGYKGALLEVIEATNQSIKYKVISNFNAAER